MQNSRTYSQNSFLNILREFIVLTKPRVNLLIMFTAIVGMLLAHQSTLDYELILFASIGIGLAASAAATLGRRATRNAPRPRLRFHAVSRARV